MFGLGLEGAYMTMKPIKSQDKNLQVLKSTQPVGECIILIAYSKI